MLSVTLQTSVIVWHKFLDIKTAKVLMCRSIMLGHLGSVYTTRILPEMYRNLLKICSMEIFV